MATGDLKNNLARLEADLKSVKFNQLVPLLSISNGEAASLLPLLHHILLDYSPFLLQYFANRNYDFYGKKDSRFIEAVYSALRDEFSYKPRITKEQFFAKGFAEQKCLFICDVLRLCKRLHQDLEREAKKSKSGLFIKEKRINKNMPKFAPMKLQHSSPTRALASTFASSPTKSPIYPPSKHVTTNFWNDSSSKFSQRSSPPIPTSKPLGAKASFYQDDSLLYYNESNYSEGNSIMLDGEKSHIMQNNDVSNIVDAGKPTEITITDIYQQSILSETPQIHTYNFEDTSSCNAGYPKLSSRDNSLLQYPHNLKKELSKEEDKERARAVLTDKIDCTGPTKITESNQQFEFCLTHEIELIKKQVYASNFENDGLRAELKNIKTRLSVLEDKYKYTSDPSIMNKENKNEVIHNILPLKKIVSEDPIDRVKVIQKKLLEAKKALK